MLPWEKTSQIKSPMPSCVLYNVQIRKSVRKKHTLPAYKLRYQPFFTTAATLSQTTPVPRDIYVSGRRLNVGQLRVTVLNCTRLIQLSADDAHVYCTISIGDYFDDMFFLLPYPAELK